MRSLALRTIMVFAFSVAQLLTVESALAHTGEDASTWHIMVEFGQWALYVAGAITAIVAILWVRARLRRE